MTLIDTNPASNAFVPPLYTRAGSRNPFHTQRTVGKRNPNKIVMASRIRLIGRRLRKHVSVVAP